MITSTICEKSFIQIKNKSEIQGLGLFGGCFVQRGLRPEGVLFEGVTSGEGFLRGGFDFL